MKNRPQPVIGIRLPCPPSEAMMEMGTMVLTLTLGKFRDQFSSFPEIFKQADIGLVHEKANKYAFLLN